MAERQKTLNPCVHCDCTVDLHNGPELFCPGAVDQKFEEQRIFRASPSSVKNFKGCIRRWASRALGHLKVPETPAQAFGVKLHGFAEAYLQFGEVPDQTTPEGRLMVEGIPFLPKRRLTADEVEGELRYDFGGVPWLGYYDWKEPEFQLIGDHKSTSDPVKWGLTAKDLPNDLQACMYAYGSGWDETRLKWLYYAKKAKNAFPVEATVTRAQAEAVLEKHVPIAREMQRWFNENPETLSIDSLNKIPCDSSSCDHVGRNCDFAEHCTLINPTSLVRKKEEPMNDAIAALQAKIDAKKAGNSVNPPEASTALEETKKEIANVAPSEEKKEAAPAEKIETSPIQPEAAKAKKETKPKADKPAPPSGDFAGSLAAFLSTLPAGASVQITVTA